MVRYRIIFIIVWIVFVTFNIQMLNGCDSRQEALEWESTYGVSGVDDIVSSVGQSKDGGYVICGRSGNDMMVVKTDQSGAEMWGDEN